ncbi:MAG TPA: c-type cytochrome [Candidatus Sulfopaludibacter sp.]|nr:c-type cytochrome [Candidatus Sulfopaludibacter sp.]
MSTRTLCTAVVAACALPLLAQHGSTEAVNPFTSPEDEQAGARFFRAQCAGCHGPDGTGTGAGPNLVSGTLRHGHSDEALFVSISKGFPGTPMPSFSSSVRQTWQVVTHLRALEIARGAGQAKGDAQAGAAVFRANCSGCHTVNGEGGLSGPDLTGVARRSFPAEIRESITNPDAVVPSEYWSVSATTAAGDTIRGIRLNEDTFSLQLRDANGRLVSLLKRDLKNFEVIRRSPMPSFASSLTATQLDDVIAWLLSPGRQQ